MLRGGIGDDSLSGGASADAFIFGQDGGHDTISHFADDVDTIKLRSNLGVSDADQALALATKSNGDVIFNFVGGEILVVLDTTKAAFRTISWCLAKTAADYSARTGAASLSPNPSG